VREGNALEPGTLLAGKFRIERLLGAGAMGAVYAIRHELTRHRRALKLLHADARAVPEIVQRFLNEASAAGRAGSPHLVETFDAGVLPSGEPYVVMELLDGETLTALLEREGPLGVDKAAELLGQAAEGMAAAHTAGIIHRDLKPDNLFVTHGSGHPFVKILDFGVSKFASDSGAQLTQTRAGVMYGSPAYMSPEQLMGRLDVDARTDVFGLGVVLFQVLTGKLPFDAPTIHALSVKVLSGQVTPVETLRADLPAPLVAIVRKALQPDRAQRHASARELADELQRFRRTSSPVATRPPAPSVNPPAAIGASRYVLMAALAAVVVVVVASAALLQSEKPPPPVTSRSAVTSASSAAVASLPAEHRREATATEKAPAVAPPSVSASRKPVPHALPASVLSSPSIASVVPVPSTGPTPAQKLGLRNDNPFK